MEPYNSLDKIRNRDVEGWIREIQKAIECYGDETAACWVVVERVRENDIVYGIYIENTATFAATQHYKHPRPSNWLMHISVNFNESSSNGIRGEMAWDPWSVEHGGDGASRQKFSSMKEFNECWAEAIQSPRVRGSLMKACMKVV